VIGTRKRKRDRRSEFYARNDEKTKIEKFVMSGTHDRPCPWHGPCVQLARPCHLCRCPKTRFCILKDPNAFLWVPNT